jgi:signal transduction histidine kinase
MLTVENQDNQGIFDKIYSLNILRNQLNNKLKNISSSNINSISSINQQIIQKQNEITKMFQTLSQYETKINTQLDSLIENLYFEIDKINMNAHQSNQVAVQTRDFIESEISLYKMQLIAISLFLILFVGITGYYYSTKITKALQQLTDAAKKMQKGIFPSEPLSIDSNDEFRLLTDAFNSMMASIKRLIKQKNEFINQLGHDLKNPLGPLVNLLPIIDKHTTNPKDKEILQVIQRNVDYMKNLVQKTLELARLNAPNTKISIKKIDLKKHVEKIIAQNKFMFKHKQINVIENIPENTIVSADQLRLEELFNNLLNNSVKYNTKSGSITINAVEKNDTILVSIQDSGIGMTKNQINHIFDEFYKADESRHDFDSSGLGMAICKSIVEKHGGTIWAESKGANKGSTFYFTIPKKPDLDAGQLEVQHRFFEVEYENSSISISDKVDKLLLEKQ